MRQQHQRHHRGGLGDKRKMVPFNQQAHNKRVRTLAIRNPPAAGRGALVEYDEKSGAARTSGLESPTMLLSGHKGQIFSAKFDPTGNYIASGGFDKDILLWEVYGKCENFGVLKGHQGAVLDLHWSTDGEYIYSASADKTAAIWDAKTLERVKKLKEHNSFVNACYPARRGEQILLTGSDDGTALIWDVRVKNPTQKFDAMYQVTACCLSDDSTTVFTGGIDNDIKVWDKRKVGILYVLDGHRDTITYLSVSDDGRHLASNAMDNSIRLWDILPYTRDPNQRCVNVYEHIRHGMEKLLLKISWSHDGTKIGVGCSDKFVYVYDTLSRRIVYKLPGHNGTVTEVAFHPKEPIILSCSTDKQIYVGELN